MANWIHTQFIPGYSEEQTRNSSYKWGSNFLISSFWLLLCAFLVYFFEIEKNKGFNEAVVILTAGFFIYVIVPLKYRKLFLVGLTSLMEIYLVGFKIGVGVLLLIIYFTGLTYIGSKLLRLTAVIISVVIAAIIYSKIIHLNYVSNVIMFGGLFLMLRYIYFLYELNYFKNPPVFIDRLFYFFLLPNASFPLFPIISPNELIKGYFSLTANKTFNKGLSWITIGIIHLLIYRIIYLYLTPSPYDVEDFMDWLGFILSSYSLIFRLTGLFYLATGFLQLFGFNLPPIFDHIYFASGFSDLWRRVNLYWRAFMMRVFYYPLVFKFKKQNQGAVLFFATLIMFACTWLLHSWQWYWIKGKLYFNITDILFWGILGVLIASNALRTYYRLKDKKEESKVSNNYIVQVVKIVAMFFLMSFLWSLWTANSFDEFLYLVTFIKKGALVDYSLFLVCVISVVLLGSGLRYLYFKKGWFKFLFNEIKPAFGISICIFLLVTVFGFKYSINPTDFHDFISLNISKKDKSKIERGYYEQILNSDDKLNALVNLHGNFQGWNVDNLAYTKTENELMKEFKPGFKTVFKGDTLSINSLGLRDKEYDLVKEINSVRIAFVGGSYIMGSGVSNEENFAALLEKEIQPYSNNKIEILNFGSGGYYLIQDLYVVEHKIARFKNDYLFYFIHSSDRTRCLDNIVNMIKKNTPFTFPFLKKIIDSSGVSKKNCDLKNYNKLKPFVNEIFTWAYMSMVNKCKEENIVPIAVYLPTNANFKKDNDKAFCLSAAKNAGFKLLDLSDVYNGYLSDDIQLNSWDTHPNEKGHSIIEKALLKEMERNKHFFNFIK